MEARRPLFTVNGLRSSERERVGRYITRDCCPRCDKGALTYRPRCHELGIRSNERSRPNIGAMFTLAIVITGDRTRSYISIPTDMRIS